MACTFAARNSGCSWSLQNLALIVFTFVSFLDPESLFSQSLKDEVKDENVLESVVTGSEEAPELLNKIDLNMATTEDLLMIPTMNSEFAASICEYRRRVRFIHSFDELRKLDGESDTLVELVGERTFIDEGNNLSVRVDSYTAISLERAPLYRQAYGESGAINFQRLSAVYRNFELYAVTDKDPGEHNFLDFYSLSLTIKGMPVVSTLILGNYSVNLGNGILFSSSSVISKGAGPINSLFSRSAYSLRPYRSRNESRFLRGGAFSIPFGRIEFTGFGSVKSFDSHVDSAGNVTSIDYTGLNLPTANSDSHKSLGEKLAGGILRYESKWGGFGISSVYFNYDRTFANRYLNHGVVWNVYARAQSGIAGFSGEAVLDRSLSYSASGLLNYDEAQFVVGMRNLRSSVVSNYGGPLSESYPSVMEQGLYFGATLRPLKPVRFGLYYDRFRLIPLSSDPERNGEEISAETFLTLTRDCVPDVPETEVYLRYKFKTKEDFYLSLFEFPTALSTAYQSKQNFRIDVRSKLSRECSVRVRLEKNFLATGESGELFLFDYAWRSKQFSINSRICFYRTATYASAFYAAEGGLPGVSEFTLLYGDGMRLTIVSSVRVIGGVAAGIKLARDIFQGEREFSVGSSSKNLTGITGVSVELSYELR